MCNVSNFNLLAVIVCFGFYLLHEVTSQDISSVATFQPRKPHITLYPEDHFSTDGVIEFTCRAEGNPKPQIMWHNSSDGQLVIDRFPDSQSPSGIHVNPHHGRLVVSNPTRGRIYSFYCNASNSLGWTRSSPAVKGGYAFLTSLSRSLNSGKNISVVVGQRVQFECPAVLGLPFPIIQWEVNGTRLDEHTVGQFILQGRHLTIPNANLDQSGEFTCVTSNIAGSHRNPPIFLNVLTSASRPLFIKKPESLRVNVGMDAKFSCAINETQWPHWRRYPPTLDLESDRIEVGSDFLILKTVRPTDAGIYVCYVLSSSETQNASLVVQSAPWFEIKPSDSWITEGGTAVFECLPRGEPAPSIYWELPDRTPLFPQDERVSDNSKYVVHTDGQFLEVRKVTQADAGRYQCTAHSSIDTVFSRSKLFVQNALEGEFMRTPPVIALPPRNITAEINSTIRLPCVSHSQQVLTEWFRNRLDRINGLRFNLLADGSLLLKNLKLTDIGWYTCVLYYTMEKNTLHSEWSAYIHVSDIPALHANVFIPGPPRNVNVLQKSSMSTTIQWDNPLGTTTNDKTIYKIYFFKVSDDNMASWNAIPSYVFQNHFEVAGIVSSGSYSFLVRSMLADGTPGWATQCSDLVTAFSMNEEDKLDHGKIPGHQFQITTISSSMVSIQWMKQQYSSYEHYMISQTSLSYQPVSISYCVRDIQSSNEHFCPSVTFYNATVALQSHIEVEQSLEQKGNLTRLPIQILDGKALRQLYEGSLVLHDLKPFHCYRLQIRTHFPEKDLPSITEHFLTKQSVPSEAPRYLTVQQIQQNRFFLRWSAPSWTQLNGVLIGYIVYMLESKVSERKVIQNITATISMAIYSATIQVSESARFVQVSAVTCAGEGHLSEFVRLSDQTRTIEKLFFSSQPWLIGTVIGSCFGWLIIIGLILLFCCRRSANRCKIRASKRLLTKWNPSEEQQQPLNSKLLYPTLEDSLKLTTVPNDCSSVFSVCPGSRSFGNAIPVCMGSSPKSVTNYKRVDSNAYTDSSTTAARTNSSGEYSRDGMIENELWASILDQNSTALMNYQLTSENTLPSGSWKSFYAHMPTTIHAPPNGRFVYQPGKSKLCENTYEILTNVDQDAILQSCEYTMPTDSPHNANPYATSVIIPSVQPISLHHTHRIGTHRSISSEPTKNSSIVLSTGSATHSTKSVWLVNTSPSRELISFNQIQTFDQDGFVNGGVRQLTRGRLRLAEISDGVSLVNAQECYHISSSFSDTASTLNKPVRSNSVMVGGFPVDVKTQLYVNEPFVSNGLVKHSR